MEYGSAKSLIFKAKSGKRIVWATEQGRQSFVKALSTRVPSANLDGFDAHTWQKLKPGAIVKLKVPCRVCGYVVSQLLRNLVNGKDDHLMCPCHPWFPWSEADGRDQVVKALLENNPHTDVSKLTVEWWEVNKPNGKTKLPVGCQVCGHSTGVCIDSVIHQKATFLCPCHYWFPWSSSSGRDVFLKHMQLHLPRIDCSGFTAEWWEKKKPASNDKLSFFCSDCKSSTLCSINRIVNRSNKIMCNCDWVHHWGQTECILLRWLQANVDANTARQVVVCTNPATNYKLKMDFQIQDRVMIELDGGLGHFGRDFRGNVDTASPLRDKLKEDACISKGKCVVRVLQTDVWQDLHEWKTWLRAAIKAALSETTANARCFVPDRHQYTTGVYASLRSSVGVFMV